MARRKRSSRILQKAQLRAYGLKAIDPNLDFGNANSLQNITQQIEQLRAKLMSYNMTLSKIDASKREIERIEKNLSELCERMLLGVAVKYGKDSAEYEMAGGVRKSDRIRKSTANRVKPDAEEPTNENLQSV
ncbi:hypothetical protein NIES2100_52210 [Calothrix sp. NIES-2100]|uniref:hypothetical protein n=1 Tax=Calothrix sp. NIES-2100 TaxID=1954172 RepID=UPI000B6219CB|nr:hypothetical protein NIES2100_52210 [Calothrix sp. NIES-2100]